jgi:hypothetical protein
MKWPKRSFLRITWSWITVYTINTPSPKKQLIDTIRLRNGGLSVSATIHCGETACKKTAQSFRSSCLDRFKGQSSLVSNSPWLSNYDSIDWSQGELWYFLVVTNRVCFDEVHGATQLLQSRWEPSNHPAVIVNPQSRPLVRSEVRIA